MKVSRRFFLWSALAVSGGLALGISVPPARRWMRSRRRAGPLGANAWIEIAPSGDVRLYCNATEMGQGVWSALAQIVCEELEADWSRIRVEMAPVDTAFHAPWGYGTGGSRSVRGMFNMMRRIGAAARSLLIQAAADHWRVPAAECVARLGIVTHARSGRELGFGALSEAAAQLSPPSDPPLKAREHWRIIGKAVPRLDILEKVNGTAVYGTDIRIPGMCFAAVMHCPVPGGRLASVDLGEARGLPGIEQVIELSDAVAVVAGDTWSAMRGLSALTPVWNIGRHGRASSEAMQASFREAVTQTGGKLIAADAAARESAERVPDTLQRASQRHSAIYQAPLISHAQLEPMNTTAWVTDDRVEVWAPTQQQADLRADLSDTLGIAEDRIVIHTPLLGGGFGRRLRNDYAVEAALIAGRLKRPVQVLWSRREDFAKGFFRPAAAARLEAGLDADGNLLALDMRFASMDDEPRLGGLEQPYLIPTKAVRYVGLPQGIRFGSWRSVDMSQNTFFLESFLDECALKAERDPLEFRRHLLREDRRAQRVLDAVADMADWKNRKARGRYLGIAFAYGFSSLTAQIAEAIVVNGRVRIARMYVAIDCGTAVSPGSISAQMQGGVLMALSAALSEEITVREGRVQQSNYDTYEVLRIQQAPVIETTILETPEAAIGGVGEAGVPPTAPAAANAVFAATGVRIRSLPMRGDARVRWQI